MKEQLCPQPAEPGPGLSRVLNPVGRWVLASELGREQGLGLGGSWQQEDFQVVAVGTGWGQVHCWNMLPSSLKRAWLRPWWESPGTAGC